MATGDAILFEKGLLPVGHEDLLQFQAEGDPVIDEGQIAWMKDRFGALRLFTYRKNVSASAFAAGDLTSRHYETEDNITAGSTTTLTGTWSGANEHIGGLVIIYDDAGAGGAAPEGECGVIVSNSATVVTIDSGVPFSVAPAANDDTMLFSPKLVDSADDHPRPRVCGIAMSAVPDDGWGWFQFHGLHPRAKHSAATCTTGQPVVAGAACVAAWGSDAAHLWVGYQMATHTSDVVSTFSPVIMTLLETYY